MSGRKTADDDDDSVDNVLQVPGRDTVEGILFDLCKRKRTQSRWRRYVAKYHVLPTTRFSQWLLDGEHRGDLLRLRRAERAIASSNPSRIRCDLLRDSEVSALGRLENSLGYFSRWIGEDEVEGMSKGMAANKVLYLSHK
jgi:hypothetical protein